MDVKKCDRCGKVFEPEKQESVYTLSWKEEHVSPVPYDLCSNCLDSLHDWLMMYKKFEKGAE